MGAGAISCFGIAAGAQILAASCDAFPTDWFSGVGRCFYRSPRCSFADAIFRLYRDNGREYSARRPDAGRKKTRVRQALSASGDEAAPERGSLEERSVGLRSS